MSTQQVGSLRNIVDNHLSQTEITMVKKAIQVSRYLMPSSNVNRLDNNRFIFCLEYFFSIYQETRKLTREERIFSFDKQYMSTQEVIRFFNDYKREVGGFFQRTNVQIEAQRIAEAFDEKVLLRIQKMWKEECGVESNAIARQDLEQIISKIYSNFQIEVSNNIVVKVIEKWKAQLSYYVIFEEFALLMMQISAQITLVPRKGQKESCSAGCSIF